jgi:hypothetical protein
MQTDPLLRRIRHAEGWLRRARTDWRRGNAPAALLRLMLAEAEIRQAREDGAAAASPSRGMSRPGGAGRPVRIVRAAAAVAAAVVLAGGIGYGSFRAALARHDLLAHEAGAVRIRGRFYGRIVQLDAGQFLMPDRGPDAAGGWGDGSPQFAVPVDLRTPSPTF